MTSRQQIASHNATRYSHMRQRHPEVRALARLEGWPRALRSSLHPSRLAEEARTSGDERNCAHAGMTTSFVSKDRQMSKSSTITSKSGLLLNPHPGEILLEEFLKPMELSQNALARAVHVAPRRINEIVLGKRDVTADTDLRLARYFGLSEGFFLGLQMDYDLMQRRREIDRDLKTIRPRAA
jgi:antitoxin HigA-1